MIYLANAFSLSMLPGSEYPMHLMILPTTADSVAARLGKTEWQSAVGHAQTAALFPAALGIEVPPNRISVSLSQRDTLFVGQYIGPRLPEGAASLPEGATIRWFQITLREAGVFANPVHILEMEAEK
jgi:hypothetical protein